MSMALAAALDSEQEVNTRLTKLEAHLLAKESKTYQTYYNGKMSYALHGQAWETYIKESMPGLEDQVTSENVFKTVIDLYGENLVPVPDELRGFSNCLVPLLSRGECVVVVDNTGEAHFPEHFETLSDGVFTVTCIYTRSLEKMMDYITFVYSDGRSRLFGKEVPDDFAAADKTNYQFVEETTGNELFRFALDDKGFGGQLAALQDRLNHSIIDLTVVAEMYARPFWYLLNVELSPDNPYMPKNVEQDRGGIAERKLKGGGPRVFTTNAEGPFGQLTPPTINDMVAYHDSIINKVPMAFGVPIHYLMPGTGTPPTGVALKVMSKRYNNKIARMRDDLTPEMERLAATLGIEKTLEPADDSEEKEYELWNTSDDLLQDALDQHGINLSQMGYPLEYIAEVVTPGVDLDDYMEEEGLPATGGLPGEPTDMTAAGQTGLPATPGQVQSYAQNPGQRAKGQ
jgi:hypothetical protein